MTSILQYGSNEIVIADSGDHAQIRELIRQVIADGRTEWIPLMCNSEDGTPQTFELLITPGIPISIVSDAPIEARRL